VKNLSITKLKEFRQWFISFDAEMWDEQIEKDAIEGKLDALAEEALNEYRARAGNKAH
jgi:hypothetical protein